MSIFEDLSIVALRHVAKGVGFGVGEALYDVLVDRFTNHSAQLNGALQKANERAWQTIESALAGPSVLDLLIKRVEDRVIAEQVRVMLEHCHLKKVVANTEFC